MATTLSHQSNLRKSEIDEGTVLFRNDANNVTELQKARRLKKLAEEAARLRQEELKAVTEDKEKIKADRDRLNLEVFAMKEDFESKSKKLKVEIEEIEKAKREKETQLATTTREKAELTIQLTSVTREKAELTTQVNSQGSQLASLGNKEQDLRQRIKSLASNVTRMGTLAPQSRQDNCLPLQYHKAIVIIMNIGSKTIIDASKENGTLAHAWEYDLDSSNQLFMLRNLGGDSPSQEQPWVIARKHDDRKLFFGRSETGIELQVGSAPDKQDYWFIGRGSANRVGSWVFKNAEWNTYIEMTGGGTENGRRILSYSFSDHSDANWVIIPIAFAS